MKFDSARVIETVKELGDARFAGRDGEARIAEFAAERLAQLGWHVERRVVLGSVLPRLAVSWLGWWLLAARHGRDGSLLDVWRLAGRLGLSAVCF